MEQVIGVAAHEATIDEEYGVTHATTIVAVLASGKVFGLDMGHGTRRWYPLPSIPGTEAGEAEAEALRASVRDWENNREEHHASGLAFCDGGECELCDGIRDRAEHNAELREAVGR